uniref:Uncharacterized protein n=1 Tax=Caenorhabditis brenneri TaxID=135651 RepID=B6VBL9_CAEBE|nr:hypothetical protein Cbre_JD13.014 [Caenorhabditis brenneri]
MAHWISPHRAENLQDVPFSHEVTSYPTEFSYEKLPEHVVPVVIEETEKKDEPSLKSKITGLFKKSSAHADYPISEQYDGPLDSTHRAENLQDVPLSHEVTSYPTEFSYEKLPEHVVPVVIEETEKKDEPSLKSKITGLFKKSSAHADYPISEQYDGPLDSTHRAENVQDVPLSHEVTSYPSEFSYEKLPEHVVPVVIEETEKKDEPSLKSKITGLFKKSSAHADYPISEQYDGPLDSTHRAENLQDVPLSHEVTSYPTEFSYEKLPEHVVPVVIEETEKKDEPSLKSKITGLFKKSSAHADYPISEQYDGPLDSTHRAENVQDVPLSHSVTSYPSEFSYEKLPEHVVPVVIEETEKKDEPSLKSKITGLFKKSSAHADYPISEQYDGPLDSTHRAENVQDVPLSHSVTSYPTEFSYEKLPEHVVPVVIEETEKKDEPSLKSKITGLFKKSSAHADYPISEQYDGPLDSTHRAENVQDVPLSHSVTSYPSEFSYEKLPEHVVPVVVEETEKKDEPSLKSKITGLFKKSSAHADYPISEQYDGPLDSTHRAENVQDVPLSHSVTSYPTEFSYEKLPEHVVPVVIEETEKKDEPSLKSKITGLFKKSSAHADYPISEQYDGPLDSTHRAENVQDVPLSHSVTSYPTEFSYEKLPEHVVPVVIEETEKKDEPSLKSKITGLFKKSPSHLDYPSSEQYDGPLDSTHRAENLQDVPLSHEVTSYPTEFSYEKLPEHVVPVVIEETEKKDEPSLKSKITGLFKKSSAHLDYPISEQYDGPLDSTHRAENLQDVPLSHEVTSYPTEFSYEKLPEHVVPVVIEETEKKDEPSLKSKITGLFKKSPSHLDYPISEQYDGPLDSTHRAENLQDVPLSHEVTSYPTEFSYEKLPEHVVPVVIEETEKKDEPSLKSKITGLFKKSSAHADYPISEQYDGPLDSTHRAENLQDVPLSHEVTSYPTEFSYEKLPEHVVPVVIEETEKKDEPSLKSKITGLFKKSSAHADYPISEQYDGPLDSTHRAENVQDVPLSHEVTSYPTEFSYEKLPEHVVPVVIEETEKKDEPSLKSKITGLFKKSSAHADYPISEQYDGPLDSTHRAENVQDVPLSHSVTSYPTEFSYEKLPEHVVPVVVEETEKKDEPSLKSKITGLFKKSSAHADYPISEQYDGPLDSTHRAENLQDVPLSHSVTSYPTEFSYEKLPEHVVPVVVEETEKKDEPSLKSKITGLFKKSSAHADYPISEQYDGPLDSTHRAENVQDVPLSHSVTSYPSEFSYEKLPEHVGPTGGRELDVSSNLSLLRFKDSGLFGQENTQTLFKAQPAVSDLHPLLSEQEMSRNEANVEFSSKSTVFDSAEVGYRNDSGGYDEIKDEVKGTEGLTDFEDIQNEKDSESCKKQGFLWTKYETERSKLSRRDAPQPEEVGTILNPASLSKHHLYSYSQVETSHQSQISELPPTELPVDKHPDFDVSFKVIPQEPKEDIGFSVSISARSPLPPLTIDESPQLLSVENLIHSHTSPLQRRLSPHTWTTVRETTEVSYIKRVTVTSSTDYGKNQSTLRRNRSPIQAVARQVHSFPSTSHQAASTTCRWTTFDNPALQVHHPIYPPSQNLYKSTPKTERASYLTNGESSTVQRNGGSNCHNGNGSTRNYGEVREIHAHDRTEVLRDDEVRRLRREDVFTVGTPFVMGRVESDERGNEYLRYNRNEELPMIEEGAMECRRSTVRARLREMDEVRLVGEREEIERQRRPIRRARQRVRNICTML